jgi:hypothetical protein
MVLVCKPTGYRVFKCWLICHNHYWVYRVLPTPYPWQVIMHTLTYCSPWNSCHIADLNRAKTSTYIILYSKHDVDSKTKIHQILSGLQYKVLKSVTLSLPNSYQYDCTNPSIVVPNSYWYNCTNPSIMWYDCTNPSIMCQTHSGTTAQTHPLCAKLIPVRLHKPIHYVPNSFRYDCTNPSIMCHTRSGMIAQTHPLWCQTRTGTTAQTHP